MIGTTGTAALGVTFSWFWLTGVRLIAFCPWGHKLSLALNGIFQYRKDVPAAFPVGLANLQPYESLFGCGLEGCGVSVAFLFPFGLGLGERTVVCIGGFHHDAVAFADL